MDESKVHAVLNWPLPSTIKELQRFLGFANFTVASSEVSVHCRSTHQHDQEGFASSQWTAEAHQAFDQLNVNLPQHPSFIIRTPIRLS